MNGQQKVGKEGGNYLMCDIRSRIRNISAHVRQNALMIIAVQLCRCYCGGCGGCGGCGCG